MNKLLILSKHHEIYTRLLAEAQPPDLTWLAAEGLPQALDLGRDCELFFGEPPLLAQALPYLPNLRWAQATWAGVERLLAPGLRRDYLLTNVRGVYGPQMSEFVFAHLLHHEQRISLRRQAQAEHRWDNTPPGRLAGKTLGLLGVGSIGAHLAATAHHFGMTVRGYTRASAACPDVDAYYHRAGLLDFAAGLDYLVVVLPNTAHTHRLLDAAVLAALPPQALLVNVGRGAVLDHAALEAALRQGRLAGAVLDVLETEPLPPDSSLWETPNLLITAHTSALNHPPDIAALFLRNYAHWQQGQPLTGVVDFELGY